MRCKKILILQVLVFTMVSPAFAGVIPSFTPNVSGSAPSTLDYTFDQNGLNGSFTKTGSVWTLSVSGTDPSAFYTPGSTNISNVYTVTGSSYSLIANYSVSGTFLNGSLNINGTVSGTPAGATAQTTTEELLKASLTGFGYNAAQATIGFTTQFQASWADQKPFTGGSGGDVVYLFNQGGVSTGFGNLSGLISEFSTGVFSATSFTNVESLAAVPLPLPAVLFGTGLTALMGFGRQRRSNRKSI